MYIGSTLIPPQSTHSWEGGQPENYPQDLTASSGSHGPPEYTQLKGKQKLPFINSLNGFLNVCFRFRLVYGFP